MLLITSGKTILYQKWGMPSNQSKNFFRLQSELIQKHDLMATNYRSLRCLNLLSVAIKKSWGSMSSDI